MIVGGRIERVLDRLKAGERCWVPCCCLSVVLLAARKQWLAGQLQTRGTSDPGCRRGARRCCEDHKSLLPVGVKQVQGNFRRGEMVVCLAPDGAGEWRVVWPITVRRMRKRLPARVLMRSSSCWAMLMSLS